MEDDMVVFSTDSSKLDAKVVEETTPTNGTKVGEPSRSLTPTGNGGSTQPSTSPSKRSSIIGLSLSTTSAITSALPNLSLSFPGSSKSASTSKTQTPNTGTPPAASDAPNLSKSAPVVSKVEPKGATAFTVQVGDRAIVYSVDSQTTMTEWVDKLKEAMEAR